MKSLIFLILGTLSITLSAQSPTPNLFVNKQSTDSHKLLKSTKSVKKAIAIDLNYLDQEHSTKINFNVITGSENIISLQRVTKNYYPHLRVYKGHDVASELSNFNKVQEAILIHNVETDKMVSIVEQSDKYYLLLPTENSREYRIIENTKEELDCRVVNTLLKSNGANDDCNFCKEQDASGSFIADVFIAFTSQAADMAGDVDAFAAAMVESVNTGLANSDINEIKLRLVGTGVTDNNPGLVRSVLEDVMEWFETELEETGADVIGAFINQTGADGESGAWGQQPGRVSANNIIRPLSFRHEIAHNFGGAHCNPDNQVVSYANGYTNGSTSTHLCGNGANFFSNPDITDNNGLPLGENGTADMARFIREQAAFISSHKLHTIPFEDGDENLDRDGDGLCVQIDCNDGDPSIGAECQEGDFRSSYENLQNGSSAIVREGLDMEPSSNLTMTAWIKPASNFTTNEISGIAMGEADGLVTGLNISDGKLGVMVRGTQYLSSYEVSADEWSYVSFSMGFGVGVICLNGSCESIEVGLNPVSFDEQFVIGQMQSNVGRTFIGKIDEVTVLNEALTVDELHLRRHLVRTEEELENVVAYFDFDEPVGPARNKASLRNAALSGCSRSSENAPVGEGVSMGMNISEAGEYSFGETGVTVTFNEGDTPEGPIYVTKINTTDDVNPLEESGADAYWIMNNLGVNQSIESLASISFMDESIEDGNKSLYERHENAVTEIWTLNSSSGEALSNSATFMDSGISDFGQYFLGQGLKDADGDSYTADVDCNDNDASINPGMEEIANNDIDENCDGAVLRIDNDNDGATSDVDCDDNDASVSPLNAEIPNNDVDENCDGLVFMQAADLYGMYCAPTRVDSFGFITWVQFGDIANQSEEATGANGVSDFTAQSTVLVNGGTAQLSVNSFLDFDETQILSVWIDWNADGEFGTDELVFSGASDFETWRSEILVPEDATGGNSIMRIRISKLGESPTEACGDATGETEDYSVFIAADNDGDNYSTVDDCNDNDASINPGAEEIVNNDIDEDCNGEALTSSTFELEDSTIEVLPNPVTETLYIRVDDNSQLTVRLLDMTGKTVYQSISFRYNEQIDVTNLSAGLYFLEITHLDLNRRVVDKIEVIK